MEVPRVGIVETDLMSGGLKVGRTLYVSVSEAVLLSCENNSLWVQETMRSGLHCQKGAL